MSQELNLLPPDRRKILNLQIALSAGEKIARMFLWAMGVLTGGAIASIALMWIMVFSTSQSGSVSLDQTINEYRSQRELVVKKNLVLETMEGLSSQRVVWSELTPTLFKVFPPGVTIDRVAGQSSTGYRLQFSGKAVNRNALIVFEERMGDLPWVKEVAAPNSNLINRTNPEYSFTLTVDEAVTANGESK